MRDAAVMENPCALEFVLDHFKIQEMCHDAFVEDTSSLQYFPDWFVTQQEVKSWHDYYDYCDDNDELVEWYEGYKRRKVQKAQIKKELMRIAWHPLRWWDWSVPEDEKNQTEKMWK